MASGYVARSVTGSLAIGLFLIGCDARQSGPQNLPPLVLAPTSLRLYENDSLATPVVDIAVSGDEIWALGMSAPFVTLYNRDDRGGGIVERFGVAGPGPGELTTPTALVAGGRTLAVWDPTKRNLVTFDSAGHIERAIVLRFVSGGISARLSTISYGAPGRLRRLGSGFVTLSTAAERRQTGVLNSMVLLDFTSDGDVRDTIVDFRPRQDEIKSQTAGGMELVSVPLWTTCGDHQLVIYDPFHGSLQRYDSNLARLRSDTVSLPRPPLTDEQIKINLRFQLRGLLAAGGQGEVSPSTFDAMVASMLEQSKSPRMHGPNQPAATALACDGGTDRVWLERFSLTDSPIGYSQTWLTIDTTGVRREVVFPQGFRPIVFSDGEAFGVTEDSLGVPRVGSVRLPKF